MPVPKIQTQSLTLKSLLKDYNRPTYIIHYAPYYVLQVETECVATLTHCICQ